MDLTPDLMLKVLSSNYPDKGISEITKVEVEPGVADHQNFLSYVLRVTSHAVTSNKQTILVKTIVKKGERGEKKSGIEVQKVFFDVEAKAYEVLKNQSNWFKKNGLEIQIYWPHCLYQSITENAFVIMLEDLKEAGYKMMDKGRGLLDKSHVSIAVDRLAKCHAMSSIYISEVPLDMANWPKPGFEFLINYWKNGLLVLSKAVVKYDKNWKYISDYLINISGNVLEKFVQGFEDVRNCYPVLTLGDCWSNNILFKYSSEDNNQPMDARFIDFQFSYLNSFAWDLHYLTHVALSPKLRLEIMDELLSKYQRTFEQTIVSLKGDPKLIPSLDEIHNIMDKLLFSAFLYSGISAVELCSAQDEDYTKSENNEEEGLHISEEWFLRNPDENGYIDNIRYFESKGLFRNK